MKIGMTTWSRTYIRVREIRLDIGENWWEGRHNDADFTPDIDGRVTNALVLHRPLKDQ